MGKLKSLIRKCRSTHPAAAESVEGVDAVLGSAAEPEARATGSAENAGAREAVREIPKAGLAVSRQTVPILFVLTELRKRFFNLTL